MSTLLLPLQQLGETCSDVEPGDVELGPLEQPSRTLDLEPGALRPWLEAVRTSSDPCFVVDTRGRLAALSPAASVVLDVDDDQVGVALAALVRAVDFSLAARPEADQVRSLPPLVALETGLVARALLRVRHGNGSLVTLDVLSSPLASGAGSLTFLQVV